MTKDKFGYMCKIDWDFEFGEALGGNKIYPSLADLKQNHDCWERCGVVKVKISLEETLHETNHFRGCLDDDTEE